METSLLYKQVHLIIIWTELNSSPSYYPRLNFLLASIYAVEGHRLSLNTFHLPVLQITEAGLDALHWVFPHSPERGFIFSTPLGTHCPAPFYASFLGISSQHWPPSAVVPAWLRASHPGHAPEPASSLQLGLGFLPQFGQTLVDLLVSALLLCPVLQGLSWACTMTSPKFMPLNGKQLVIWLQAL